MSTTESRKNTVARLLDVWNRHPHLRLAQLILNVHDSQTGYYLLDAEFVADIENIYGGKHGV